MNKSINEILKVHKNYFYRGETKSISFRLDQLRKLKNSIKEREEDLIKALYEDLGKPSFEAYATEIGYVLDSIRYMMKHLKSWAKVKKVKTPFIHFGAKSYIYSEPYGTVLIIGPFNYPFQLLIEPLIGAMASGNCMVLKPSENTPYTSNIIKNMIKEKFDEKYISVIEGGVGTTSSLIHAPFDYIFFTGSIKVGKIVMEAASKNLVPITLELGGKSPCIIEESANLDIAAQRVVWGKFLNVGQTCVAPDYLLVHKNVKKEVLKKIKQTIRTFYGENPSVSKDYGKIVNEKAFNRLIHLIDKNKVVIGGEYNKEDLYIGPTIIDEVNWEDPIMEDEIFGPILPIIEYEDLNSIIQMINERPKPLALYLFTENKKIKEKVIRSISFGGGCINDTLSHVASPYIPFGGVGTCGIGSYHGKYSFDVFSHKKSVMKKTTKFNLKEMYPPYHDGKLNILKKILK